jgi:hypothetical protein
MPPLQVFREFHIKTTIHPQNGSPIHGEDGEQLKLTVCHREGEMTQVL